MQGYDGNEFALTAFTLKSLKNYASAFNRRVNVSSYTITKFD